MGILKSMIQFRKSSNEQFCQALLAMLNNGLDDLLEHLFGNEEKIYDLLKQTTEAFFEDNKVKAIIPDFSIQFKMDYRTMTKGIILQPEDVKPFEAEYIFITFNNGQFGFYTVENCCDKMHFLVQREEGKTMTEEGEEKSYKRRSIFCGYEQLPSLKILWNRAIHDNNAPENTVLSLMYFRKADEYGYVDFKEETLEINRRPLEQENLLSKEFEYEGNTYHMWYYDREDSIVLIEKTGVYGPESIEPKENIQPLVQRALSVQKNEQ